MFFYTSGGGCFLLNLKKKKKHPHPTHTPPDMYRKDVFLLKKHRKSLEITQGKSIIIFILKSRFIPRIFDILLRL